MKYKKLVVLLLLLMGAIQLPAMQDHIPIPIDQIDDDVPIPTPKDPYSPIISCSYDTSTYCFTLVLRNIVGTTSFQATNLSTGESFYSYPIGEGSFFIPTTGSSGLWRIIITLPNGTEYVGEILL